MMTVSTSPAFVWRTSSSSVIFAVFSWRRDCPLARSVRGVVARSFAGVTVRAMSDPSCSFKTDENVFDFCVELQRVHAELASDATSLVTAGRRATGQQSRAFLPADLDVTLDPLALLDRNQGSDLRARVERIANL